MNSNHAIRKIVLKMRDGENQVESVISTISGNGKEGCKDGDLASSTFNYPWGVCVNSNGDIFVSDWGNHKIRKMRLKNPGESFVSMFS